MTDQFHIFLVCVFVGVFGGLLFDVFFVVRNAYRKRWLRTVCDFLFALFFAALYLAAAVVLAFPPLRFFDLLGCIFGLFLYLKSFHKIVAFFSEKLYNKLNRRNKGKTEHGRRGKRTNTG